MSEQPAETAPAPQESGKISNPTGLADALNQFYGNQDAPMFPSGATFEDVIKSVEPATPPEGEKAPETPETPESPPETTEPDVDTPDLGFETDPDAEEPKMEGFDADSFDKDTENQIKGLDPKQGDAWKKLRSELKEAKIQATTAAAATERMAELERKAAKVEELTSKVEELTAADYSLKVQASEEYREKVRVPAEEINSVVKQISEEFEVDPSEILSAIRETSLKARAEMIDGLTEKGIPALAVAEIQQASATYRKLQANHERMLANAETEWKEVQKKKDETTLKESEADREAVKRHLADHWAKVEAVYGKEAVAEARRRSEAMDIRGETPANRAKAQLAGNLLPVLWKENHDLRAKIAHLESGVAARKAASPSLADGATAPVADNTEGQPKTFAEAMRRMPNNLAPR